MKIYSDDNKEFKTVDECNAYEANLKLQKEKEMAERKERLRKMEEERKVRDEKRKQLEDMKQRKIDEINAKLKEVSSMVSDFSKATSSRLGYTVNSNNELMVEELSSYYFPANIEEMVQDLRYFFNSTR